MATVTALPSTSYPTGTTTFGPIAVPVGSVSVQVFIDRASIGPTPLLTLDFAIQLSQDGGQTWLPWGGARALGGVIAGATQSSFRIGLPSPATASFYIQGKLILNGGATTAVSVEFK